jgi:hypothetical protein
VSSYVYLDFCVEVIDCGLAVVRVGSFRKIIPQARLRFEARRAVHGVPFPFATLSSPCIDMGPDRFPSLDPVGFLPLRKHYFKRHSGRQPKSLNLRRSLARGLKAANPRRFKNVHFRSSASPAGGAWRADFERALKQKSLASSSQNCIHNARSC